MTTKINFQEFLNPFISVRSGSQQKLNSNQFTLLLKRKQTPNQVKGKKKENRLGSKGQGSFKTHRPNANDRFSLCGLSTVSSFCLALSALSVCSPASYLFPTARTFLATLSQKVHAPQNRARSPLPYFLQKIDSSSHFRFQLLLSATAPPFFALLHVHTNASSTNPEGACAPKPSELVLTSSGYILTKLY